MSFLVMPCGLWDLNSLTRDWTLVLCRQLKWGSLNAGLPGNSSFFLFLFLWLYPDFRGQDFSFFTFEHDIIWVFSRYGLYYFPTCNFLFLVCWVFYHEKVLNCKKKKKKKKSASVNIIRRVFSSFIRLMCSMALTFKSWPILALQE